MKTLALILLLLFSLLVDVQAQSAFSIVSSEAPDTVRQGENAKGSFVIRNNSNEPVFIQSVTASISCCQPSYSKEIIAPGRTTMINWRFVTQGKTGLQDRVLTATFSNDSVLPLRYRFYIVPVCIDTSKKVPAKISDSDTAMKKQVVPVTSPPRPAPAQSRGIETLEPQATVNPIEIIQPGDPEPPAKIIQDTLRPCSEGVPSYPGGIPLFVDSLTRMTRAKVKPDTTGKCFIQMTVLADGSVTDISIIKSIDPEYERELIKNIPKLGKWIPACRFYIDPNYESKVPTRMGEPVKSVIRFPVPMQP